MSFDPSGINWDFGQGDQQPSPAPTAAPMPDNINWGNVFGQVGYGLQTGADFLSNNSQPYDAGSLNNISASYPIASSTTDSGTNQPYNPGLVSGEGLSQRWDLPRWMGSSDGPNFPTWQRDKGFAVPQMTSPNDIGFNASPTQDWGITANKYNSYWTPTPPRPTEFSPLEQFQQDLWRGTLASEQPQQPEQPDGYNYRIAQYQFPPTPEDAPEPYLNSWQWKMANSVWDLPPQLPTLPPGTSR